MTRQSLSRFLSDRRELRTFMTLPFHRRPDGDGRVQQRGAETIQVAPTCQPRKSAGFVRENWHKDVLKEAMRRLFPASAALGLMVLAGCASRPVPVAPPPPPAPVAQTPSLPPLPAIGGDDQFQAFVHSFESVAVAEGITPETYNRAMAG